MESRPPSPPFDEESATLKVRLAEDAWNSRDPARVALAYSRDSQWRNRSRFLQNGAGHAFCAYGNEDREFANSGLMRRRIASINDLPIHEADRKLTFDQGRRPDDFPGLTELGL